MPMSAMSISATGAMNCSSERSIPVGLGEVIVAISNRDLHCENARLETLIDDNREQLQRLDDQIRKAEQRVKGLTTMIANLERQEAELNDEITQLESDIENGAGDVSELRRRIASLETTGQKLEGKRDKLKLTDRNEILKCAMYLFLGYLDGATQFAQSCGGGGGDTSLPWGRKEDEDDRRFAYRCMIHAYRMMKPSQPKRGISGRR